MADQTSIPVNIDSSFGDLGRWKILAGDVVL